MKLPKYIANNSVLKITSLNAVVITTRLVISVFVQRLLAIGVGEAGIAALGQIRNILSMLSSISTMGVFNGIIKYVAEYKDDQPELLKLFSTVFVFTVIGSVITAGILFFGSEIISERVFNDSEWSYIFKLLAFVIPFIALHRVFGGVINGISDYKKYAKIEFFGYVIGTVVLLYGLYNYSLDGVLIAVAIVPCIQLIILLLVFGKVLKEYIRFKALSFKVTYARELVAFTLMSFVSTFLINYIELDVRVLITDKISVNEAGYWTAMTFISKNYMVFATGLFTLYVLPKFAQLKDKKDFYNEVIHIYKTILPIFGLGMLLVYVLRYYIIQIIYPDFDGMEPLFKWQLLGDFIRLCSLVIAHQFLAKRMVKSFVVTELISLGMFYTLSITLIGSYGTEGVVIAHLIRYIIYFVIVILAIWFYFEKQKRHSNE